jgi:hypothetical protein
MIKRATWAVLLIAQSASAQSSGIYGNVTTAFGAWVSELQNITVATGCNATILQPYIQSSAVFFLPSTEIAGEGKA